MRDKLVATLLKIKDRLCDACGKFPAEDTTEYIADHLIANGVTFATDNNDGCKWIPVSERLPGVEHCQVLAVFCGFVNPAIYWGGKWEMPSGFRTDAVTHWMPMPNPPKDGDVDG